MTSSPSYVIEAATLADSDNYTCVVSNKMETLQHHIDLRVFGELNEDKY